MNLRLTQFACVLLLVSGQAGAGLSSWDEVQLQLLQQYSTPLRWDNVEGPPQWVSGPEPRYQFRQRLHFIDLRPGEEVTLRAAPGTWLRLAGQIKTMKPEDLEIGVSTDARLFVAATSINTIDPYSMLIELPGDKPSLVRLLRPLRAETNMVFAAYFSRVEPFNTLAPYRETVRLPGDAVHIRREGEATSKPAWALNPGEDVEFPIEGPARLQLVTLLRWPVTEPMREQSLVLHVSIDHAAPIPLIQCPELDSRHRTRVDHSTELVSARMNGFVNVPGGSHHLRLQASAPAYVSVFRQSQPDFLLPGWNGPATNTMPLPSPFHEQITDISAIALNPLLPSLAPGDWVALEQEAWSLARDNQPMEAGAQAADWLERLTQSRQDYPTAQRTVETLWDQRTSYREILPALLPGDQPLKRVFFEPDRLQPLYEPEQHVVVYNPTLEQVDQMLADGHFAEVSANPSAGLLYEIPERAHDSELRIAAMTSSATRTHLTVQFDREPPFTIVLDAATALPEAELATSQSLATLRVLEQELGRSTNLAVGHAVDGFDVAFPVERPGVSEIPLPQHVRQVRIQQATIGAPVLTSVAYRAAKPFELGETGYLALLNQVDPQTALQALAHPEATPDPASQPLIELQNHWLPLTRLLKAHFGDFTNGMELVDLPPRNEPPLDFEMASTLKDSALIMEEAGQLIEATAIWNRLFWEGMEGDRMEAALAIMGCLESLNEEFLAAQYARYVLLKSPGPEFPAQAVALLADNARHIDDTEQLEELRSFLFLRCPCPEHLADLTDALALNGRDEQALFAGLILSPECRPAERMLEAALHQNWWQTFDQLVEGLKESEARCFWRAQKHLAFYRFAEAEQELKQANGKGRPMLHALQQGLGIREQLGSADVRDRLEAVLAWEEWQKSQPGPSTWRTARDIVQAGFTTELLFNCEQNRFAPCLRAELGKPVTLRFLGPLRLRVEARPILDQPFDQPVDDWLEFAEYGITNRVPISHCVPNPSLRLTFSRKALAGVKTVATLEWGPGWHEVEVAPVDHPALIRVLQEQPVLPTRVLPTLNAHRLNLVLQNDRSTLPVANWRCVRGQSDLWWIPSELARFPLPLNNAEAHPSGVAVEHGARVNDGLTGIEKLRLALRRESTPERLLGYDSREFQGLPPLEQWLAACRAKRWSDFTQWATLPESEQVNGWLASGRIQDLLDSEIPGDVIQRLTILLQISELYPPWCEQAQCLAELLAAEPDCPPGGRRLLSRITENRTWVPLKVSPLSAGIRPIQVPFDQAQDPATRLRRALLPPAGTNQFTLSARSEFSVSVTLQHPTRFELHAEPVKAGFSPLIPLTVSMQVDALQVQQLSLGLTTPQLGTNFMLSEGPHLIRVWIEDPVVNQWVRIVLKANPDESTSALGSKPLVEMADERRFFHAATPTQPLRFSWRGPALLRVDEDRAGRLVSQLRWVPDGNQTVEIPPAPGRAESWYQIFVRDTQTNQFETRTASTLRTPVPLPPPIIHLPESEPPSQAQLTDYYQLGGQEGGTWTPGVLLAHRRPFEISDMQNTVENEFVEVNLAYRKSAPSETAWFKTEALARWHRPGDLTLGLSERVEGHPRSLPFDWSWLGEAFVGTVGPEQQDVEWALHTGLDLGERFTLNRKLDWYPSAGLFAHYLSLNPATAAQYNYIDQDLYTSFRNEQRWGGVLGSRLDYRPWLDTLLQGGVYLMSNEDFTPDNWGMRFSWTQLMGPFHGEVAYRFRYFLDDADRSSASLLHGVSAGVFAEHWVGGRHRVEVGVQFSHDWPDSGNSYYLVLRCDFSQGRGYKDYSPHEAVFRDLRSRLIPAAFNNHLQPGSPGPHLP